TEGMPASPRQPRAPRTTRQRIFTLQNHGWLREGRSGLTVGDSSGSFLGMGPVLRGSCEAEVRRPGRNPAVSLVHWPSHRLEALRLRPQAASKLSDWPSTLSGGHLPGPQELPPDQAIQCKQTCPVAD